jgi:hypothetical protein
LGSAERPPRGFHPEYAWIDARESFLESYITPPIFLYGRHEDRRLFCRDNMNVRAVLAVLPLFPALAFADPNAAKEQDRAPIPAKIDFSRDILPIISTKCFHCHGPDESHRAAKLRLDVRDEAIKDRKGSIAIKPGDLKASDLIARITTKDEDDVMPPPKEKKPLTPREIELFKKWIQQGAPYAEHWAFVKPKLPAVPKVSGVRVLNPIDSFIAAKLKESKLKQSPVADRHTLIRRVSLDLTGPMLTRKLWIICWPHPPTANAWRGCGWTSRATRTARATALIRCG